MSLTDIGNMDNMGNIEEFYVINRKGNSVQLDFNKILCMDWFYMHQVSLVM